MVLSIVILILMLILSGFFSGSEIAFLSASKLKIELKSIQGSKKAELLSEFVKNTPRFITTILVGNNLALVIYGIFFEKAIDPEGWNIGWIATGGVYITLIIQTLLSTLIILVFGEYLPKALARINPDRFMQIFANFLRLWYVLFGPVVVVTNALSRFFLQKVLRLQYEEKEIQFSKKDLDHYIRDSLSDSDGGSPVHEIDAEMFANALEFNKIRARDCMIPRTEIHALPTDASLEELMDLFIETEHSRIIIYEESIDRVVGYVHSSSLFRDPKNIAEMVQPLLTVPESMAANVLLTEFSQNRKTIAIVVDEFGGTEGMITMEDLVEEVFGEIEDEHDEPEEDELLAEEMKDGSWLFSGRLEVSDLNKEYDLQLPEGDYVTLSGLVMHFAETIPAKDESVMVGSYRLTVIDSTEKKINAVKVKRLEMES